MDFNFLLQSVPCYLFSIANYMNTLLDSQLQNPVGSGVIGNAAYDSLKFISKLLKDKMHKKNNLPVSQNLCRVINMAYVESLSLICKNSINELEKSSLNIETEKTWLEEKLLLLENLRKYILSLKKETFTFDMKSTPKKDNREETGWILLENLIGGDKNSTPKVFQNNVDLNLLNYLTLYLNNYLKHDKEVSSSFISDILCEIKPETEPLVNSMGPIIVKTDDILKKQVENYDNIIKIFDNSANELKEQLGFLDDQISKLTTDTKNILKILDFENNSLSRLKPFNFEPEINEKLKDGFEGREWIYNSLKDFIMSNKVAPLYFIFGNPGSGKSTIMAKLINDNLSDDNFAIQDLQLQPFSQENSWLLHDSIVMHHLCNSDSIDTMNPRKFVYSLAAQLKSKLKKYSQMLISESIDPSEDVYQLMKDLIIIPLAKLKPDKKIIILIDALDESYTDSRSEIVDLIRSMMTEYLKNSKYSFLKMIITSRNSEKIKTIFSTEPYIEINSSNRDNINDITAYFIKKITEEKTVDAAVLNNKESIEIILHKSQGNFLYLKMLLKGIAEGHIDISRPDRFPDGLNNIYLRWFERKFPLTSRNNADLYELEARPLLEIIVASVDAPDIDDLAFYTKLDNSQVEARMRPVEDFFVYQNRIYSPYHKALTDWLIGKAGNSGRFKLNINDGNQMIFKMLKQKFDNGIRDKKSIRDKKILTQLANSSSEFARYTSDPELRTEALKYYHSCWEAIREISSENIGDYTQSNTWFEREQVFIEQQIRSLEQQYEVAKKLYDNSPESDMKARELINICKDLMEKHVLEGNIEKCRKYSDKINSIIQIKIKEDINAFEYIQDYILNLNDMGNHYLNIGNTEMAYEYYDQSFNKANEFYKKNLDNPDFLIEIRDALHHSGKSHLNNNNNNQYCKKCLTLMSEIDNKLINEYPDNNDFKLSSVLSYPIIIKCKKSSGLEENFQEEYEKGIELAKSAYASSGKDKVIASRLNIVYEDYINWLEEEQKLDYLGEYLLQQKDVLEVICSKSKDVEKEEYWLELAECCGKLGCWHVKYGFFPEALDFYKQKFDILLSLIKDKPSDSHTIFVNIRDSFISIYSIINTLSNNNIVVLEYLKFIVKYAEEFNEIVRTNETALILHDKYVSIFNWMVTAGKLDNSETCIQKAIDIVKKLHQENKENITFLKLLSKNYKRMGDLMHLTGNSKKSFRYYDEAIDTYWITSFEQNPL